LSVTAFRKPSIAENLAVKLNDERALVSLNYRSLLLLREIMDARAAIKRSRPREDDRFSVYSRDSLIAQLTSKSSRQDPREDSKISRATRETNPPLVEYFRIQLRISCQDFSSRRFDFEGRSLIENGSILKLITVEVLSLNLSIYNLTISTYTQACTNHERMIIIIIL
jgi:hypothetical protein